MNKSTDRAIRTRRQAFLVALVKEGRVSSQIVAQDLLAKNGIEATQATISRDFEELGLVRFKNGESAEYKFQNERSEFGASLRTVLSQFVVSATSSGSIAVLKTPPGHAPAVAAALDRAALPGILGTVAGDDTLFVCGSEELGGAGVVKLLSL